jgi:hypothetical protein
MKKYEIKYKTVVMYLNKKLISKQNCEDNLVLLKKHHKERLKIEFKMGQCSDKNKLKKLYMDWFNNELILQELWKFEKDTRYFKFWTVPHCSCPKLDNIDAYPYMQIYSTDCPIHGEEHAE